jgi:predicted phage terminase large subunit-like protein
VNVLTEAPPKQSPHEIITAALREPVRAMRKHCDNSLYNFLRFFWDEVSTDEFKENWHIEYECQEAEKVVHRVASNQPKLYDLIINIPPGTTKTKVWSVALPAWCWTKWYWMSFITGSYSADLSLESAEYCRDLIRSEKFRTLYPELDIKQDKEAKGNFKVVKKVQVYPGQMPRILQGGSRYSTSVGATVTGFHGHVIIVDDPLNPEQAVSDRELATANRWMEQTLSTRKVDKAITPTILIMQRLHQDDPTGHILAKKKQNVKHICLPGEIRNYMNQVNPPELIKKYKNDLLDPVRMNWDVLKDLEDDLGQYGYAGQVGQDPTPPGGGMFHVDHLQVIDELPNKVNFIETVRYWDKAGTEGGKGAYTVGVKISSLTNKRWIVHDVRRGRWGTDEREDVILETAEADGRDVKVYVEQEPGSGGKESAQATIRNLAGFAVEADHPTGNKIYRADPFSVQVNNGNVMLMRGDWNHDYIEELRFFPFGTFKDQVDGSSGAFGKLTMRRQVRMLERRR